MRHCIVPFMVQNGSVKIKSEIVHDHHLSEGSEKFDIKKAIAHMKEVGYRDSDGYLVLPDYYDDDIDYSV